MIFNINFFLVSFAMSCMWSYTFVFAQKYANVPSTTYGILGFVLPLIAFFAKPTACSLTDARGIHKQFLVGALSVYAISYSCLGALAFLKKPDDGDNDALAWIVICICMVCGSTASSCIFCMNDALASNYARKNNKSYSLMRIWSNIGWASGAIVVLIIGNVKWLPFRVPGIILLVTAVVVDILLLTFWPYEEDFEMFHDGTTIEQRKLSMVGPNTVAYLSQNKPRGSISRDMIERIKTGRSKSVGNLRRNSSPLKPLDLNQKPAKVEPSKELKDYSNLQCQLILLKMIATGHKSFFRYIFLFVVFGVIQGMHWNFQLAYVGEQITKGDEVEFEKIANWCMIAQSFLGEIPINAIATHMVRIFGPNANMSLALVSIGLRCFFYSQLLPYLPPLSILFAEALQGPSLGLYWILIVDVGSNYALMVNEFMPEMKRRGIVRNPAHEEELNGCLRASMIGAMSSSMEGLGVAAGALLGGFISDSLGYIWMWNFCAYLGIFVGFMNISLDIINKLILGKGSKKKEDPASLGVPVLMVENVNIKL